MSRTRQLPAKGKTPRFTSGSWVGATLGALAIAVGMAACGGGSQDKVANDFVRGMATQGATAPMHALADALPAATPLAAAVAVPGAKELFDWAEYKYPELFFPKQTMFNYELTYEGQLYTVRSFPNGNHLGLTPDGRIYGLGPFTDNVLQGFGTAADYAARVAADKCSVLPSSCFVLGQSHTVNIGVPAGGEVADARSGVRLLFAEGGSGQVTMTELTSTAPVPASTTGAGWRIEYSGSQKMEIVLDGAFDGSADWPAVYRFEELTPGAVDDDRGVGSRWVPLPVRQVGPGRYAFEVSPGTVTSSSRAAASVDGQRKGALAATQLSARDYYIAQMAQASTDAERRSTQYSLGNRYLEDVIALMPTALATQVNQRRAERLPSWGSDGNYYRGFRFVVARHFYPQINVTFDNNSLAHELGHYLTHMMVGDDIYEQLEAQPYLDEHGVLDVVGRGSINEDYAYVIEFLLIGTGGGYNLDTANDFLRDRPAGVDIPSLEGYAAAMMASLVRPTTSIPSFDLKGRLVDVPTVGLSRAQLLSVIASGATDLNALRHRIEAVLDDDGRRRLLVNLQRLGWRYSATLRVVDDKGQAVADADARLVVRAGGSEYVADVGRTDAQGALNLWFAFPGQSTLVVTRDGETLEGQVTVDPSRSTQERIALGDVPVRRTSVPLQCGLSIWTNVVLHNHVLGFDDLFDGFNHDFYSPKSGNLSNSSFSVDWNSDGFSDNTYVGSLQFEISADQTRIVSFSGSLREHYTYRGDSYEYQASGGNLPIRIEYSALFKMGRRAIAEIRGAAACGAISKLEYKDFAFDGTLYSELKSFACDEYSIVSIVCE